MMVARIPHKVSSMEGAYVVFFWVLVLYSAYAKILEARISSIFKAEVRSVRKWMI
jgi:hypothetical protein